MTDENSTTRLATAGDLIYKAYSRDYVGGSAKVISVFASCHYGTSGWRIFFQSDGAEEGTYKYFEKVPSGVTTELMTYYTASFTEGIGATNAPESVKIIDAHGEHDVVVEPLN